MLQKRIVKIVKNQGGDPAAIKDPSLLPKAKMIKEIKSEKTGWIKKLNALSFGKALIKLGGGREKKEDTIDPSVGFEFTKKVGDPVSNGETIVKIHYNNETKLKTALSLLQDAIEIVPEKTNPTPLIIDRILP